MTNADDFRRIREDARVLIPTLGRFYVILTAGPDISWEHFNIASIPQYNVPLGFDVNEAQRVALAVYHESGHEFEEDLSRKDPQKKHRQAFLTLIGETSSWDELKLAADRQPTPQQQHDADPGEWWADAFADGIALRPQVGPYKVQNIDPLKWRRFFQELIGIVPLPSPSVGWPIIQAPSPYFSRGWWNPPTNIALHSTAGTLASTLATFTSPDSTRKVSAHFTVDGFGQKIYQHVDLANRAWHAIDANEFAVGIEHVDNGPWGEHPEVTYEMSAWLISTVIAPQLDLAIDDDVIGPHSRWVATACPAALDWGRIITEAGGITDMPTEAVWLAHLEDEKNTINAMKDVLARLAHARHPLVADKFSVAVGEHLLDPNLRGALKQLDAAIAKQTKNAKRAPKRTAASARAGHGRGKSKDVEE